MLGADILGSDFLASPPDGVDPTPPPATLGPRPLRVKRRDKDLTVRPREL